MKGIFNASEMSKSLPKDFELISNGKEYQISCYLLSRVSLRIFQLILEDPLLSNYHMTSIIDDLTPIVHYVEGNIDEIIDNPSPNNFDLLYGACELEMTELIDRICSKFDFSQISSIQLIQFLNMSSKYNINVPQAYKEFGKQIGTILNSSLGELISSNVILIFLSNKSFSLPNIKTFGNQLLSLISNSDPEFPSIQYIVNSLLSA